MKLTRAQKMYVGVLGLALGALILDRTVFAPVQAGGAAMPLQPVAADLARDPVDVPSGGAEARAVAVADRLRAVASRRGLDTESVTDAFHPSEAWRGPGAVSPTESPQARAAREFQANYRLLGVMTSDGRNLAMIEDIAAKARGEKSAFVLPIGENLGLFKLVSVDDREAVFAMGELVVVLRIRTGMNDDDGARRRGYEPADAGGAGGG